MRKVGLDVAGQTEKSLFVVGSDVVFLLVILCCFYILFQSTNGCEDLKWFPHVLFAALHQFHTGNYFKYFRGINWKSTAEEQDFCLQSYVRVIAAPDL